MSTIEELKKERVSMLLVEQNAEMALASPTASTSSTTAPWSRRHPRGLRADVQVTSTYLGVGG